MTPISYHKGERMSNPTDAELDEFLREIMSEARQEQIEITEVSHPAFDALSLIFDFHCDAYEEGEAKAPSWCPDIPPNSQVWPILCRSCKQLETCLSATQNRILTSVMGWTGLIANTFIGAIPGESHRWWISSTDNEAFFDPNPALMNYLLRRASALIENLVILHGTLLSNLSQENSFLRDIMPNMPAHDPSQVEARKKEIRKERQQLQEQVLDHIRWMLALVIATTRYSILSRLGFDGGDIEGIS